MMKIFALLCIAFIAVSAQSLAEVTNTTTEPFASLSVEVQVAAGKASIEVNAQVDLTLAAEKIAEARAAAKKKVEDAETLANALAITAAKIGADAALIGARAAWNLYQAGLAVDAALHFGKWTEAFSNLTQRHQAALDKSSNYIQRAVAVIQYHLNKMEQRVIAADLYKKQVLGEALVLNVRVHESAVFVLNNLLAELKNGIVDGKNWTIVARAEVKEQVEKLAIAHAHALYKADNLTAYMITVRAEIVEELKEMTAQIANILKEAYLHVKDLRNKWKARAGLVRHLANGIRGFVADVSAAVVVVSNLEGSGNISVSITVTYTGSSASAQDDIVRQINVYLAAYAGVNEAEVSTTIAVGGKSKRAAGYTATSQIGTEPPASGSASAVIASVGLVAACLAAAF